MCLNFSLRIEPFYQTYRHDLLLTLPLSSQPSVKLHCVELFQNYIRTKYTQECTKIDHSFDNKRCQRMSQSIPRNSNKILSKVVLPTGLLTEMPLQKLKAILH